MARDAALLHRIVCEFHLGELGAHLLVTVETQTIASFQEIKLVRCAVGIVAFHAVSFQRRLVDAPRLLRDHRPVTLEADFARLILEQLSVGRRVGVVTSRTLPGLDRGVYKLSFQGILKIVVAVETPFPARIGLQLELVLRLGDPAEGTSKSIETSTQPMSRRKFMYSPFLPFIFPPRGTRRRTSMQRAREL